MGRKNRTQRAKRRTYHYMGDSRDATTHHKEGLILNICFVVIPVVGPAVVLSRYGLSLGWVFLCFPFGIGLGMLFYAILNSSVTLER